MITDYPFIAVINKFVVGFVTTHQFWYNFESYQTRVLVECVNVANRRVRLMLDYHTHVCALCFRAVVVAQRESKRAHVESLANS